MAAGFLARLGRLILPWRRGEEPRNLLDRQEIERLPLEGEEDWYARVAEAVRAANPGALTLWRERKHPLVRAAMTIARKRRAVLRAICVGIPLAAVLAEGFLDTWMDPRMAPGVYQFIGWFACLWPTVCILGAAWSAAASVTDERDNDTAIQLVLTPLPRRVIAAARVLPAAWPFLWGLVAALPIYLCAGGLHPLLVYHLPTPLLIWPFRLCAPAGPFRVDDDTAALGSLVGTLMFATDVAMLWAAAHWGTAYAVRLGRLPLTALYLVGRLAIASLWLLPCAILTAALASFGIGFLSGIGAGVDVDAWVLAGVPGLVLFAIVWYRVVLRAPVRMALEEFAYFDRLADEEFVPRYRKAKGWAIPLDRTARR